MPDAPKGYYVYELIDPTDGTVFYVGKGKGRRVLQHECEARRLTSTNREKHERIAQIHRFGFTVGHCIVAEALTEADAFQLERETIARHGLENLTNATRGSTTEAWRTQQQAHRVLRRLRPPGPWLEARTSEDRKLYAEMRRFLTEVAASGRAPMFDAALDGVSYRTKGGRPCPSRPSKRPSSASTSST